MTEDEWLRSSNGVEMLNVVRHDAVSERKARLFAVACSRIIWQQLGDSGRKLTELAELLADDFSSNVGKPLVDRLVGWLSILNQRRRLNSLLRNAASEFGHDLVVWSIGDMEFGPGFFAHMAA